jgi:UDP-GlcNAc:undecaprenyl-phosphate GlcNAc-1-phosphate transferase
MVGWPVVALLVAVPLADTTIAVVRRLRAHRPLFAGDRSHVYDQLVDRGRTRTEAVVACIAMQAVLVGVGVAAWHLPPAGAVALGALAAVVIVAVTVVLGFIRPSGAT